MAASVLRDDDSFMPLRVIDEVIDWCDRAEAPGDIAAHLDMAKCRLADWLEEKSQQ